MHALTIVGAYAISTQSQTEYFVFLAYQMAYNYPLNQHKTFTLTFQLIDYVINIDCVPSYYTNYEGMPEKNVYR